MSPIDRATHLSYRPLRLSDWDFCWALASDPTIRAVSLGQRPPTWLGHLRWMWRWARDGDSMAGDRICRVIERMVYVPAPLYLPGYYHLQRWEDVGLVRAARLPGGGCEVSIALLVAARGQGVGTATLKEISPHLHTWGGRVFAQIKLDNLASVRAFTEAGNSPTPPSITWLSASWLSVSSEVAKRSIDPNRRFRLS